MSTFYKFYYIITIAIFIFIIFFLKLQAYSSEENGLSYSQRIKYYKQNNIKLKSELAGIKIKSMQLKAMPERYKTITSNKSPILEYLLMVKEIFPQAEITGRFFDWRSVSKYRRNSGLHYGYDIYMELGTKVPAAWAGTVTAITPWYGEECGVTVLSDNGLSITYGHVKPCVFTGQRVEKKGIVALCWSNHVDIKVRDGNGNFVDIANPIPVVSGKIPVDYYKDEYRNIKKYINLTEAVIHMNIAEANIDYIESNISYYNEIFRWILLQEKSLNDKISKVKNKEEKNNIYAELEYLKYIKALYGENFIKAKSYFPAAMYLIETHLPATEKNFISIRPDKNIEFKLKYAVTRGRLIKSMIKYNIFKSMVNSELKNKISSPFPPEELFSINIKSNISDNELKDSKRDLKTSLNLYIEGLINYDQINKYKEDYKRMVMKKRIEQMK